MYYCFLLYEITAVRFLREPDFNNSRCLPILYVTRLKDEQTLVKIGQVLSKVVGYSLQNFDSENLARLRHGKEPEFVCRRFDLKDLKIPFNHEF